MSSPIVVMGVSGSGKSTVGAALAQRLRVPYADADDFHPPANVEKMSSGEALDDDDRYPWLESIGQWLSEHPHGGVMSCSALKRKYRDQLREHCGEIEFPDEDWVFQVLPELEHLEADTLDALLSQAVQHAKYEKAARDLLLQERARLEAEHAEEMRGLRVTMESEAARSEVGAEIAVNGAESNPLLLAIGAAATLGAISFAGNIATQALKDLDLDLDE